MSRFVRPETRVVPLSNGDTVTLKKRLTAGEERDSLRRMYLATVDGGMRIDPLQTGMATILAYLVDWTLTDDAGAVVPIRHAPIEEVEQILNSLDPDDFREILRAVEAHEVAMGAEREAEKKSRDGASGSLATSPSPSTTAGGTNGSPI